MNNSFWENQYIVSLNHHVNQNVTISQDFLKNLNQEFIKVFESSKSLFEFGCGTGELCEMLKTKFSKIVGVDISKNSIEFAKSHYSSQYSVFYILTDENPYSDFDLVISSNVLEHFKNPFIVLDKLLKIGKNIVIIVHYNQNVLDSEQAYSENILLGGGEGGGGHWFRFSDDTFKNYNVLSSFKFNTNGWTTSTSGEPPLQIAYLVGQ